MYKHSDGVQDSGFGHKTSRISLTLLFLSCPFDFAGAMGNKHATMAVLGTILIGKVAGVEVPGWALAVIGVGLNVLLYVKGGGGAGAKIGTIASALDGSVVFLQGERATPGIPGKVVVIERWATWCPPCVASVPHLNALYAKYKERNDFQIVGVTGETDESKITAFIEKHKMAYPVALDTKGTCARDYPSSGIPNATIIGRDRRIFWNGHPMKMDAPLEKALGGETAPTSFEEELTKEE